MSVNSSQKNFECFWFWLNSKDAPKAKKKVQPPASYNPNHGQGTDKKE